MIVSAAKPADRTQMDNLVVEEKDALNVFDRGYVDYEKFDSYCKKGIRFVTRLKSNAKIKVVKELAVNTNNAIEKDQIVYLGTNGINRIKHPLRIIKTHDTEGKPVIILTNNFKLTTREISDIYRYRWQIEFFFKWLKQQFHIKHFYGLSQQAVENQMFIALITYCLLMLLKLKTSCKGSFLAIKRLLKVCLLEPFASFVKKLHRCKETSQKTKTKSKRPLKNRS
jgi:IS4 transposase